MLGNNKLISIVVLMGILLSPSVHSYGTPRNGAEVKAPIDRDIRQEPTLKPADYTISGYRAGLAPIPGTPINQIQGDTPPPPDNSMSRMIGIDGTMMGDHE